MYHYHYSFSNCSAVVLVLVSQPNSSRQQLLSRTRISTQLQQPAVRSRRKAATKESKAVGTQQAEGDTRVNKQQAPQIFQAPQLNISPAAIRTETSPRSNTTAKIFCSTASRTGASPQDPPSSGSTRSSSVRDPESVRTGIGPTEAGGRDPLQNRARNENRGPEIGGERIPV